MVNEKYKIQQLKEHLSDYKVKKLGIFESGSYHKNPYTHILPKEYEEKNIIDCGLIENISKVPRHHLFHHLNSSQALCINLFGPLVRNNLCLLNVLFKDIDVDLTDSLQSIFEFTDDLIKDKSSFDFFIESSKHERLYFEIKYTESTLHTTCQASNLDSRWQKIYSDLMTTILNDKNSIPQNLFFKQYQLWRNICRVVNTNCNVYFVFPKFRDKLVKEVEGAKALLKPDFATKVHILMVDEICDTLLECGGDKYKEYYMEFKHKYLPSAICDGNI